jgi:hypothetical protein
LTFATIADTAAWSTETILDDGDDFFLNQTFYILFLQRYTSFVKPKNRLHRPKSSPWWFFCTLYSALAPRYTVTPQRNLKYLAVIISKTNIITIYKLPFNAKTAGRREHNTF